MLRRVFSLKNLFRRNFSLIKGEETSDLLGEDVSKVSKRSCSQNLEPEKDRDPIYDLNNYGMITKGFATPEGTFKYKSRALQEKEVHFSHFRQPYRDA